MDVKGYSAAIATIPTAGTDADTDADVTALNVIDVATGATTATTDGLSHQRNGIVSAGANDEIFGN